MLADESEALSVAAVCRRSGLNRTTFYLHYTDVSDLAADVARTLVQDISVPWGDVTATDPAAFAEMSISFLATYLEHVNEQRAFYEWLLGPGGSWTAVQAVLDEYAETISRGLEGTAAAEAQRAWTSSLLAGALFGVVVRWVAVQPDADPHRVAQWLWGELTAHPTSTFPTG